MAEPAGLDLEDLLSLVVCLFGGMTEYIPRRLCRRRGDKGSAFWNFYISFL
jgi:CBS domain containing-hemolysin-like protein